MVKLVFQKKWTHIYNSQQNASRIFKLKSKAEGFVGPKGLLNRTIMKDNLSI